MVLHPFWLVVLVVAIIVVVQLLKHFELVQEKIWMVPSAAVVGVILVSLISYIANQAMPIEALINSLINGTILGFASSGLYDLVTAIRNPKGE